MKPVLITVETKVLDLTAREFVSRTITEFEADSFGKAVTALRGLARDVVALGAEVTPITRVDFRADLTDPATNCRVTTFYTARYIDAPSKLVSDKPNYVTTRVAA